MARGQEWVQGRTKGMCYKMLSFVLVEAVMNRIFKSNSSINSRSSIPPNIINEENISVEETDSSQKEQKSSDTQISLTRHTIPPPQWFPKVTIIICHEFERSVIVMIDSGSYMNCIQKRIIPSKYYEKLIERLFSTNRSQMMI